MNIFFFHVHKAAGTTIIKMAEANKMFFADPNKSGMPGCADIYSKTQQAFDTDCDSVWSFWGENIEKVKKCIKKWGDLGVEFVVQEYGEYNPVLWKKYKKIISLRNPINRLYSDFLHQQDSKKIPSDVLFEDWIQTADKNHWQTCPLFVQLGRRNVKQAKKYLKTFDLIIDVENMQESVKQLAVLGWEDLDCEKNFKSWTERRMVSGLEYVKSKNIDLGDLLADEFEIYNSAINTR